MAQAASVHVLGADKLARNLRRLASDLPDTTRKAARTTGAFAKQVILQSYESRIGGKGLRNMGGAQVRIDADFLPSSDGAVVIKARGGPAHLFEKGAKPHVTGVGAGGKRTAGLVRFPDGSVRRGPIPHPGFGAPHAWTRGAVEALAVAPKEYQRQVSLLMARCFAG